MQGTGRDTKLIAAALPAYEVSEKLGSGAWGVVRAARHRSLGRDVAIKQLPPAFAADEGVRARFRAEARLLASLDHPNIVTVHDFVEEEHMCLLVMERLTGGTVWSRFEAEGFSHAAACALVISACAGLHHAHEHGVLHRDIKPENLMFSAEGVLKVTDFGIAKVVGGAATMATRSGMIMGTPAYIAPEQAMSRELTPATDVYALGTVLYELLGGNLPYPADSDPVTLLYQHVHEDHRPLREIAPSVPAEIEQVVARALRRDPAERPQTASEFGAELAAAAARVWGPSWSDGHGVPAGSPAASIIQRPSAALRDVAPTRSAPLDVAPSELVPVSELPGLGRRLVGPLVFVAVIVVILALTVLLARGG